MIEYCQEYFSFVFTRLHLHLSRHDHYDFMPDARDHRIGRSYLVWHLRLLHGVIVITSRSRTHWPWSIALRAFSSNLVFYLLFHSCMWLVGNLQYGVVSRPVMDDAQI